MPIYPWAYIWVWIKIWQVEKSLDEDFWSIYGIDWSIYGIILIQFKTLLY